MKVLHTADWHLGQRFQGGNERIEEQQCFLDWLLTLIEAEGVEVLVVAGDVFDTGNPPAAALELYYSFLARLRASRTCRDVVIVSGNHDSPASLNASATLLKALRVHVVGGVPARFEDQCIRLPHDAAAPRLVVAAVPFLRDADVRRAISGESMDERESRVRDGIAAHYRRVGECVSEWRERGVPVLATGHLFAAGGTASDSEKLIHIGSLGQITADAFPAAFDYVALGHLHRPQRVGGTEHIRYSGAPIPLSFTETEHPQQVVLLTFEGAAMPTIELRNVPCARRLVRLRGSLEDVLRELAAFDNDGYALPAWADVQFESAETTAVCFDQLRAITNGIRDRVRLLGVPRHFRPGTANPEDADAPAETTAPVPHLDTLRPVDVFGRLLDQQLILPETDVRARLQTTFHELLARVGTAD
jgi:DNA repair protein SbcD/Mre11